ncbi:ranBP-type and C3HC4-type zinc finger-containing protein 1-like isoform X2 [Spea bombifrons]|uniref:ranBP-type and C3HC4-type zinc finger-containing protein 1-like isoform X2 n=1 Tax=Spea bombifrons TaxID=233779 RepID=UPI002349267A|nr:ranBP-type and C3HC4-type zinc finger-containing protein 1-like isoform X2 [Spea bombifrons]
MASGAPGPNMEPLPTVLMSAWAWREAPGSGRDNVLLQLSVEPDRPVDFRLLVRRSEGPRGPAGTVVEVFKLKDISYELKSLWCHELTELTGPGETGGSMIFNFDDKQEAQKWWTVVSSSLREARKASQGQDNPLKAILDKPATAAITSAFRSLSVAPEIPAEPTDFHAKEELAQRLSRAIESGDEQLATRYAAALAKQRTPLHIQPKPHSYPKSNIHMKIGVEDASGSVNISTFVQSHTTIAMLKQQIYREFRFHPSIQRWIIGQCLCADGRSVASYGIKRDGDTAFLYLISARQGNLGPHDQYQSNAFHSAPYLAAPPSGPAPINVSLSLRPEISENLNTENVSRSSKRPGVPGPCHPPAPVQTEGWSCPICTFINKPTRPGCEMCSADRPDDYVIPERYKPDETEKRRIQQEKESIRQYEKVLEEERRQNFLHLLQLDSEVLIPNQEAIECRICFTETPAGDGVLLRECLHSFCRECLRQVVNCCEDPEVSCPFRDETYACYSKLQQREIRALVSQDEYSRFLERGLVVAESRSQNSYHCRTADCKGWCIYEDSVNEFICPICYAENCLICKAIHNGMNCREYQDDLRIRALNDAAARQTNDMLKTLVQTGEAMYCPLCQIIVQKKDGCDWIRCTMCQTEICWVTKGPRWGPLGPGDSSGGCRCNVNGKRCDPKCQNCH